MRERFARSWRSPAVRLDAALALLVLAACAPFVPRMAAAPASRYDLTAAIVEHRTVDISGYPLGVDHDTFAGHLRSDKAPGQPLYGVPFHALFRLAGGTSPAHGPIGNNLGLWWQTLWACGIPLAALAVCMRRTARRFAGDRAALFATLAVVFGTLLFAYAADLWGHVLAAALIFGAWSAVSRPRLSPRAAVLAGFLAGYAVITEYQLGAIAAVFAAYVAWRHRSRIMPFLAGAVPPAALGAAYQTVAFRNPLRTSYNGHAGQTHGFFGITFPGVADVGHILFSSHGILLTTPIVVIALAVAALDMRDRTPGWHHAAMALTTFGILFVVNVGMLELWIGESPGPRYLVPAMPFLAVPLARRWASVATLAPVATAWGLMIGLGAHLTRILVRPDVVPFRYYLNQWRDGRRTPTLFTMALGTGTGYAVHVAIVAVAIVVLIVALRALTRGEVPSRAPHLVALAAR